MTIIFDLDGTLADCEHRKHFIIKPKLPECCCSNDHSNCPVHDFIDKYGYDGEQWKPNWEAFFQACNLDTPIEHVFRVMQRLSFHSEIQIWSGRCESVKEKTIDWFIHYRPTFAPRDWYYKNLKMRPIGDYTPDDELKQKWLDEHIAKGGYPIEFVVDDRPKVLRMWQWNGIFTFDVGQGCEEF